MKCIDSESITVSTLTDHSISVGEASSYSPGPPPPPASSPMPDMKSSQLQRILKTVEDVIEREKPALQTCELNIAKMRIFGCLGSMAGDDSEYKYHEMEERARFLLQH